MLNGAYFPTRRKWKRVRAAVRKVEPDRSWIEDISGAAYNPRRVGRWNLITRLTSVFIIRWMPLDKPNLAYGGKSGPPGCESRDSGAGAPKPIAARRFNLLVKAETPPRGPVLTRKSETEKPQSRWITYTPLLFYNVAGRRTRERTPSQLPKSAEYFSPLILLRLDDKFRAVLPPAHRRTHRIFHR